MTGKTLYPEQGNKVIELCLSDSVRNVQSDCFSSQDQVEPREKSYRNSPGTLLSLLPKCKVLTEQDFTEGNVTFRPFLPGLKRIETSLLTY